jgi:hypothetical protein
MTYAWLMRIRVETDRRFCEKTPGNCFIIPFLDRCFTGAKFIHIVRDGRDAALSLSKKPWYKSESRHSGVRDPDGTSSGRRRGSGWKLNASRIMFEPMTSIDASGFGGAT